MNMGLREEILEVLSELDDEAEGATENWKKPENTSYGHGYHDGMKRAVSCIEYILGKREKDQV